jgi:hypothetical protein
VTFEDAWQAVTAAGRPAGNDPHAAVDRLIPDSDKVLEWLYDHNLTAERTGAVMVGIAVGLLMAEDEGAMCVLAELTTHQGGQDGLHLRPEEGPEV